MKRSFDNSSLCGQEIEVSNNQSQATNYNELRMDEDRKPNEYQVALKKGELFKIKY